MKELEAVLPPTVEKTRGKSSVKRDSKQEAEIPAEVSNRPLVTEFLILRYFRVQQILPNIIGTRLEG